MVHPAASTLSRVDASPDGALSEDRQAALATWRALDDAAETPGVYWYEEHNCPLMSPTGTASVVQVTNGAAALVGRRVVCGSTCEHGIERYGDLVPATLPALIAACQGAGAQQCSSDEVTNDVFCVVSVGADDGTGIVAGGAGPTVDAARDDAFRNVGRANLVLNPAARVLASSCP